MKINRKTVDPMKVISRLSEFINDYDIYALVFAPIFGGVVFMVITALIYTGITHGNNSLFWNRIIGSIGFFIMGFSGIFQIVKREILIPVRKTKLTTNIAIINGVLFVILCWSLTIGLPIMSLLGY